MCYVFGRGISGGLAAPREAFLRFEWGGGGSYETSASVLGGFLQP